jgi:hypothetical protein
MPTLSATLAESIHPEFAKELYALPVENRLQLESGLDHLDQIAFSKYGNHQYWEALGIYNNIIHPFDLIECGITEVLLFNKEQYISLIRKYLG